MLSGITSFLLLPISAKAQLFGQKKKSQDPISPPVYNGPSVSEMAQNLSKIDEDLNAADANVRLAAFNHIMASGSAVEKTKALNLAAKSVDQNLRSMALKYTLANIGVLYVYISEYKPEDAGNYLISGMKSVFSIQITNFDLESGKFSTISLFRVGGDAKLIIDDKSSIIGTQVNISAYGSWSTSGSGQYHIMINLKLKENGKLEGFATVNGYIKGGPWKVVANLFDN